MKVISVSKIWLMSVIFLSSTIPLGLLGIYAFSMYGVQFEGNKGSAASVLCVLLIPMVLFFRDKLSLMPANLQYFIFGIVVLLVGFSYIAAGSAVH